MVLSFEPDAERECTPCPLIKNDANFILHFEILFGIFVISVAIFTFGRAALADITGPCLVKMDRQGRDATIPAAIRRQLAAGAQATAPTALIEPPGMQAGARHLDTPHPSCASELPTRCHPARRRGHSVAC
jgi:hypothetical protein